MNLIRHLVGNGSIVQTCALSMLTICHKKSYIWQLSDSVTWCALIWHFVVSHFRGWNKHTLSCSISCVIPTAYNFNANHSVYHSTWTYHLQIYSHMKGKLSLSSVMKHSPAPLLDKFIVCNIIYIVDSMLRAFVPWLPATWSQLTYWVGYRSIFHMVISPNGQ